MMCCIASWPQEGWDVMRVWGDLFKLIVGVRWMISTEPIWWGWQMMKCKVGAHICSLPTAASCSYIWDAVTVSSLLSISWGCGTFLPRHHHDRHHRQHRQHTPVCWAGVTGIMMQYSHPIFPPSLSPHLIFVQSQILLLTPHIRFRFCKYSPRRGIVTIIASLWRVCLNVWRSQHVRVTTVQDNNIPGLSNLSIVVLTPTLFSNQLL